MTTNNGKLIQIYTFLYFFWEFWYFFLKSRSGSTEICFLGVGPAICWLLGKWNCICKLIKELGKDEKSVPRSSYYQRMHALLTNDSQKITKVQLWVFVKMYPWIKKISYHFQKKGPTIHLLFGSVITSWKLCIDSYNQKQPKTMVPICHQLPSVEIYSWRIRT